MIIAISGSVGTGKTSISNLLARKLEGFEIIHLNDIAKKFKICDVKEIQTFDFDIENFLIFIETQIKSWTKLKKNLILEGHFSHLINPKLIDKLIILNRDLKELKIEYVSRNYCLEKIKDNLEVEAFNLCFYEGLEEGYIEGKQIFSVKNDGKIEIIANNILNFIK